MNHQRSLQRAIGLTLVLLVLLACNALNPGLTPTPIPPVPLFPVFKDGKAGYIDTSGNIAIQFKYDGAAPFSEGLASVQLNGQWGYVNADGEMII
jgi:hypothetical protein